ncbi:MAG TPA: hypothetical protein VIF35_11725, partial [Streptosporangiaceae bacterium]
MAVAVAVDRDVGVRGRDWLDEARDPADLRGAVGQLIRGRLGRVQVTLPAEGGRDDGHGRRDGREREGQVQAAGERLLDQPGEERAAGDVRELAGAQVLQGPGRAEQFLDRVEAEERGEQAADRRLVRDQVGGRGRDPRVDQPPVQGSRQVVGQAQRDDGEEQAHGQHRGRVLERVQHPGAGTALVRRQAVHDRGLVRREEQPHADGEHEDQQAEPDVAEVDRQQLEQQEAGPGHGQADG